MPPVRDQGTRGTCVAFAVTAAHERVRGSEPSPCDLAEEVLYWGCKQIDGDAEPGTTFTSSAAALATWGQPDEERWPYDPLRDDQATSYQPPPGSLEPAICCYAGMHPIEATHESIKHWLQQGYAVVLALWLTEAFLEAAEGVIRTPPEDEARLDGHAVLVVGYADEAGSSEGVLIVRNSWGDGWGDAGYGYLPYGYLDLGSDAWVVELRNT